jgi:hypothetical protein
LLKFILDSSLLSFSHENWLDKTFFFFSVLRFALADAKADCWVVMLWLTTSSRFYISRNRVVVYVISFWAWNRVIVLLRNLLRANTCTYVYVRQFR